MGLREKTLRGTKWSAISTVTIISLSFLQLTLLSHMLGQSEFGIMAVAMVVITFADNISDFGISNSIIQQQNITEPQLATLYWLNVGVGIIVSIMTFSAGALIADILNTVELEPLIKTASIAFLLIPHGQQLRALMQKELDFATIGKVESCSYFIGFIFTLGLAHIYPLAIVTVYGYLINTLIRTLLFAHLGRKIYRPGLSFSFSEVKANIKFGACLTADSLVNYINTNFPTLILARTLGTVVTGGYNLAYNVTVIPPGKLNPIITRVFFPVFSKIQKDNMKLKDTFYKLISLVGIINFPALLGLMTVSHSFISFIFGERWLFITPIFQILCVVGLLRSVGNPIGSLLMAKARVDISFKFNVFKTLLFIPAILVGIKAGGAVGVATAFLVVQIINTYLSYFILIKPVLGPSYRQYIESLWLPFKLTIPAIIVSWSVGYFLLSQVSSAVCLFVQVFLGISSFAATLYFSKAALVNEMKLMIIKGEKTRKHFRMEN